MPRQAAASPVAGYRIDHCAVLLGLPDKTPPPTPSPARRGGANAVLLPLSASGRGPGGGVWLHSPKIRIAGRDRAARGPVPTFEVSRRRARKHSPDQVAKRTPDGSGPAPRFLRRWPAVIHLGPSR